MPVPVGQDVYDLLEGYNLDLTPAVPSLAGTTVLGSSTIAMASTAGVSRKMSVSGPGIPLGSYVGSVVANVSVTFVDPQGTGATAAGSGTFSFTGWNYTTEKWIANMRDRFVIPWVQNKLRASYQGIQDFVEYYSGDGSSVLHLKRRPIVSLVSISYTNVVANQYFISPLSIQVISDEGILKAKANFNEANYTPVFARGERNLRVEYTVGAADFPPDVFHVITCGVAEKLLAQLGARTGGGSLTVNGIGRNYGALGKYTDVRNDLARQIVALMKVRTTGVVQG